jgi:hypothetical protein
MEEKFSKEMEIKKKNQVEILEIKTSISNNPQFIVSADKIKQKKDCQKWRTRSRGYYIQTFKTKMNTYDYNTQAFCYRIKRPNVRNQSRKRS